MYKIKKCIMTCSACPSQWDMWTDKDEYIYIRYRWGHFEASIKEVFGEIIKEWDHPSDSWHGVMSTNEMIELTVDVFDFSDTDFS